MARRSRVVIPGAPHHVTQRGNRRERRFFEDGDDQLYLDLLAQAAQAARAARAARVEVWGYCLMPNHAHLIVTPSDEDGLWRTFRKVHRHYNGVRRVWRRVWGQEPISPRAGEVRSWAASMSKAFGRPSASVSDVGAKGV